jgi:hypothetical protein
LPFLSFTFILLSLTCLFSICYRYTYKSFFFYWTTFFCLSFFFCLYTAFQFSRRVRIF